MSSLDLVNITTPNFYGCIKLHFTKQFIISTIFLPDTDLSIMSRALDSGRGKKFLREFEEKNKCGVKVEKKNDKEFPTVRSFPSLHG